MKRLWNALGRVAPNRPLLGRWGMGPETRRERIACLNACDYSVRRARPRGPFRPTDSVWTTGGPAGKMLP